MTGLFQQLAQRMVPQGASNQGAPGAAMSALQGAMPPTPPQQANGLWSKILMQQKQPPQGLPGQAAPPGPPPQPQGPPSPQATPNPHAQVPPAAQRFANAQKIQEAYANNWQPNPVLLRAMLGRNS